MLKTRKLLFVSSLTFLLASTSYAETFKCERAIYNDSNSSWNVVFNTVYGHAELTGSSCMPGHCLIPAKQHITVKYYYDNGTTRRGPASSGKISVIDHGGTSRLLQYYSVDTGNADTCPQIESYDTANGVALNNPMNGDIKIQQDLW